MRNDEGANQPLGRPSRITPSEGTSENLYEFDITPNWSSDQGYLLIGLTGETTGYWMRIRDIMLQEGTVATPYQPHSSEIVGTNNVISAIEMDSSGVKISGNKISLTGTAEFNSAFGSNRGITAIDGGKIETNRMVAKRVDIVTSSGRKVIIDGQINRSQTMTTRLPRFQDASVHEDGSWYRTLSTKYVTVAEEYFEHVARYLMVAGAVHRWGTSGWADARMETRAGQVSNYLTTGNSSSAEYGWMKIDLGEPLDVPTSGSVIYQMKSRDGEQSKRMHLGNRFLTDSPEDIT